jgi:hypothetical protein
MPKLFTTASAAVPAMQSKFLIESMVSPLPRNNLSGYF